MTEIERLESELNLLRRRLRAGGSMSARDYAMLGRAADALVAALRSMREAIGELRRLDDTLHQQRGAVLTALDAHLDRAAGALLASGDDRPPGSDGDGDG